MTLELITHSQQQQPKLYTRIQSNVITRLCYCSNLSVFLFVNRKAAEAQHIDY